MNPSKTSRHSKSSNHSKNSKTSRHSKRSPKATFDSGLKDVFHLIAGLVADIPTYKALSLTCNCAHEGCLQYKEEITRKYNKITIWLGSRLLCSTTYEKICSLSTKGSQTQMLYCGFVEFAESEDKTVLPKRYYDFYGITSMCDSIRHK